MFCQCGCGQITKVAENNNRQRGWNKGEHIKFVQGHNSRTDHPMQGKKQTAEAIKKMMENRIFPTGEDHSMFGKTHTPEVRRRLSELYTGVKQSPDLIKKRVEGRRGYRHSAETRRKIGVGNKGKFVSEETNRKNSEAKKSAWQDPAYARKCLVINSPNKQEMKLMGILDLFYPGDWKFVGDGQVIIAGKCPDFINVNGQKKIIELYGERWHKNDDPQDRADIFSPFGYETLVVWVNDLKSMKRLLPLLKPFCQTGTAPAAIKIGGSE